MKRKMYAELVEWKKKEGRKPLLLTGARQVGKTYLLKEFGRQEFQDVVYLNLDKEKERFEVVFSGSIAPREIILRLETLVGRAIKPGETLIIFDEVQEIPRAITALKYFCEEAPEYHVAASGSLLGVALHQGTSFPVGKVDQMKLSPLDFEEYMEAMGEGRLLEAVSDTAKLEILVDRFEKAFREYLLIGGMPEAVAKWVESRDYAEVDRVQGEILLAYRDDVSKHVDATTAMRILQIWDSLPAQFAKRNEKFMFNVVREGARAREYELAVQWLVDCELVRKVERVKVGDKVPLKFYVDSAAFKLYFLDVGLFRHLAGVTTDMVLSDTAMFDEFNGFFVEQFVLQQMANRHKMYYWSSEANAEVDFVAEFCGRVVPIEVKSGTNVKAKSLKTFREKYQSELAVRFSLRLPEYNDRLLSLPIYLAGLTDGVIESRLKGGIAERMI